MAKQFYFIPVLEFMGGVSIPRPNGDEVSVRFLIEGIHGDADRLIEMTSGAPNRDSVIVQSVAGTAILGKHLDLGEIVGWAIEKGYLETLG